MRQPFSQGLLRRRRARERDDGHEGRLPGRPLQAGARLRERDGARRRAKNYPKPDGKYTFDKLSSVFASGNATRDDAPNHIRIQQHVPLEIAQTWVSMCPAQVYEIPEDQLEARRTATATSRRARDALELRAVRRDHRQGRAPDAARGRRRAALHAGLSRRLERSDAGLAAVQASVFTLRRAPRGRRPRDPLAAPDRSRRLGRAGWCSSGSPSARRARRSRDRERIALFAGSAGGSCRRRARDAHPDRRRAATWPPTGSLRSATCSTRDYGKRLAEKLALVIVVIALTASSTAWSKDRRSRGLREQALERPGDAELTAESAARRCARASSRCSTCSRRSRSGRWRRGS